MTHRFCQRCWADAAAVTRRKELIAERGPFVWRGVDYGPALEYDVLPKLLPIGDPADDRELAVH